jgi:hypothetical protein
MPATVEAETSPQIQSSALFLVLFSVGAFFPVERIRKTADHLPEKQLSDPDWTIILKSGLPFARFHRAHLSLGLKAPNLVPRVKKDGHEKRVPLPSLSGCTESQR